MNTLMSLSTWFKMVLFWTLLLVSRLFRFLPGPLNLIVSVCFLVFVAWFVTRTAIRLLRRLPRKWRWAGLCCFVALIAVAAMFSGVSRSYEPRPLQFDGPSTKLERTKIVPTLDWPATPDKNIVWCASFQAAWKRLQADLAKEPVMLEGAESACAALNASGEPEVPDGELYAVAGWEDKGILDEIRREKARRFPGSTVPEFPDIVPGSFVAYGYLQSKCEFDIPYFDNDEPFEFTDGAGQKTSIRTFGIREKDDYAYFKLREQVDVLFVDRLETGKPQEFAVDLCHSSEPTQIVFARVSPGSSLAETLNNLEARIQAERAQTKGEGREGIGPNDILLVPEIAYRLVHRFADLQGKYFQNKLLSDQRMDVALQEIQFRLDRSGAELISESKLYMAPIPTYFVARGPFLIYLKERGASLPYFVMWVENDELLTKWPGAQTEAARQE